MNYFNEVITMTRGDLCIVILVATLLGRFIYDLLRRK